ncbi:MULTISPECIES: photosystem II protein, Psb35-related [Roseofilum]|uniref:Uncharacterized protein n=2 Tax=Roseofilum TaxID=1233426 RepID=A0ABT7AZY5_9CYAN|nr:MULTISPECIES: hypothetical protein [Roseofilum]MDJ1168656.1 hypothetical protein [Roseofilum acuticapitatum BLCC-M154]MDJ1172484.1 hypothetical protein [Roseofilum capinflatum BLCC-M114]
MVNLVILSLLFIAGWVAASVIGTQAYFMGEQTKSIHERNWDSDGFNSIAKSVTGQETDYTNRVPGYSLDSYGSNSLAS